MKLTKVLKEPGDFRKFKESIEFMEGAAKIDEFLGRVHSTGLLAFTPSNPEKPKEDSDHDYPGVKAYEKTGDLADFFTSDCANGCGCWMGSSRSGGPDGVDPFGKCPKVKVGS